MTDEQQPLKKPNAGEVAIGVILALFGIPLAMWGLFTTTGPYATATLADDCLMFDVFSDSNYTCQALEGHFWAAAIGAVMVYAGAMLATKGTDGLG